MRPSEVVRYLEGEVAADSSPVVAAVHRLLGHADAHRRLGVHANADTGADAARARRFGATGIGLCRTEHMFLGERRALVERLILPTATPSATTRWPRPSRCSAATSPRSSPRWTACR